MNTVRLNARMFEHVHLLCDRANVLYSKADYYFERGQTKRGCELSHRADQLIDKASRLEAVRS